MKLKKCPCGKVPDILYVTDSLSGKWIDVTGDCCGEWTVEGKNNYDTKDKRYENAVKAWNNAPREGGKL